ncbi:sodium:solute symporter family protein [Virgibacillus sp. NKC19-16]|uniref:sodium:solute symporter family protein n=1 Tax=Virgibacillus salidurans TaxID=2831673 RepID=UPI001F189497|nr:sodium:solute symporter family protein [Virgibacillus sp. NKC19-16]UJL45741.1 sodium:solute symporter family protein [Virgibacillus sp. NKC19-16]
MDPTMAIVLSSIGVLGIGVAISFFVGRRQKGIENWNVGGRSLPMYVVAGSQFATGMGGGVLVAHIGIGYDGGLSAITYNLLYSFGIILLVMLAGWLKKQNFSTLPDIFRKLYGEHKIMMSAVTVLAIVVPFGWLCTQLVAFGNLFTEITGLSFTLLVIIFAAISLLFVLPGGLSSVAWTDFVFGCFMLILAVASGFYMLNMAGGWSNIVSNVPENFVAFPEGMGAIGTTTVVLWIFAIFPGALTNQMSYQRIYAAKDAKTAKQGFIIAAIAGVFSGVWASFMGISILSQNAGLENSELAAGWFLTQIPTWFLAIYSAFIIATIMSTVSSAVQSVVVNITNDIYKSYINPEVKDRDLVKASRGLSVLIVILAIVLSLYYPQALGWLQATYAYSAAGLLVPIFLGIALRRTNFLSKKGAMGGIFLGVIGAAVAQIIDTAIPYAVYGVVASLVGFILVSFIFKNKSNMEKKVAGL